MDRIYSFSCKCFLANRTGLDCIPYSRKYWRSLNLAVWPQTESKKYWQNLNLMVMPHSVLHHHQHCVFIRQCSHPLALNKAMSSQIYKKYNWQHPSTELEICTACVDRCWARSRVLQHALRHYALGRGNNIGGF